MMTMEARVYQNCKFDDLMAQVLIWGHDQISHLKNNSKLEHNIMLYGQFLNVIFHIAQRM